MPAILRTFSNPGPALVLLALLLTPFGGLAAQSVRAGGEKPTIGLERLSQEEAATRLANFRQQRPQGGYRFAFELAHKPHRSSRTIRFEGTMWGAWEEGGPVTRFRIDSQPIDTGTAGAGKKTTEAVEMIVRSGAKPSAWIRETGASQFRRMSAEEIFAPVIERVLHRPFDLQMPFLQWQDFRYEGPDRIGVRAAVQSFLLFPPARSAAARAGVFAVRLAIDDDYNALKRVEVLNSASAVSSEFTILGVKKVDGRYIPSRISLKDLESGDRTDFRVLDAEVGLRHDPKWFDPQASTAPLRPEGEKKNF